MENLDVLRANGFEVKVDEDRAPGRGERVSLTAMPVSKETTFDFTGGSDVDMDLRLRPSDRSYRPRTTTASSW